MNIKTGIDIIEVDRIKDNIEKYGNEFLNRIYTEKEIEYCEGKKTVKFQSYAARFAAKEAVFKALSDFIDNKFKVEWKNIEILNDENGRPYINLYGNLKEMIKEKCEFDLSLSHIKDIAIANVVVKIEKKENKNGII